MGFDRPQLQEVSLNAFCQAAHLRDRISREAYKYVLYPWQFALQYIHLTTQSRAGLCLRQLISSSPLSRTDISTVLTFVGYIEDCKPDSACERYRYYVIPTRCTAIHISRLEIRALD